MKLVTAYQVHASGPIVRLRRSRRAGGISFAAVPITVALEPADGVHEVVTQQQLDEILADTYLTHTKVRLTPAPPSVLEEVQAEAKAEKKRKPPGGAKGKGKKAIPAAAPDSRTEEGAGDSAA